MLSIVRGKQAPCVSLTVKRSMPPMAFWRSNNYHIFKAACIHPLISPLSLSGLDIWIGFDKWQLISPVGLVIWTSWDIKLLLGCQSTTAQHILTHLYNLPQMAAILSNREALLIYFPLIMLIFPTDSKPLCTGKIKKNGGYLFLLQLQLPHTPWY